MPTAIKAKRGQTGNVLSALLLLCICCMTQSLSLRATLIDATMGEDKEGCSYEGKYTITWGPNKDVGWESSLTVEAHDNEGNFVEKQITRKDDGTNEVNIDTGRDRKRSRNRSAE
jgi:hypothetical protein